MRNVSPHTDTPVGIAPEGTEFAGTVFGVVHGKCILQVAHHWIEVQTGTWVAFDDSVLHSVQADRQWLGFAVQVVKTAGGEK